MLKNWNLRNRNLKWLKSNICRRYKRHYKEMREENNINQKENREKKRDQRKKKRN